MQVFKRDALPIEDNILIDEESLINMFGFVLLLKFLALVFPLMHQILPPL